MPRTTQEKHFSNVDLDSHLSVSDRCALPVHIRQRGLRADVREKIRPLGSSTAAAGPCKTCCTNAGRRRSQCAINMQLANLALRISCPSLRVVKGLSKYEGVSTSPIRFDSKKLLRADTRTCLKYLPRLGSYFSNVDLDSHPSESRPGCRICVDLGGIRALWTDPLGGS